MFYAVMFYAMFYVMLCYVMCVAASGKTVCTFAIPSFGLKLQLSWENFHNGKDFLHFFLSSDIGHIPVSQDK